MSTTKKADPKVALGKQISSYINMMTDARLDGINCTQSVGVDLSGITSVFATIDRRSGNTKKIDIAGTKGAAFATSLVDYLAKCYTENGGLSNPSITAIREYCDRWIPNFGTYYIRFDENQTLRAISPAVNIIANSFALTASDDKAEAVLVAKY